MALSEGAVVVCERLDIIAKQRDYDGKIRFNHKLVDISHVVWCASQCSKLLLLHINVFNHMFDDVC